MDGNESSVSGFPDLQNAAQMFSAFFTSADDVTKVRCFDAVAAMIPTLLAPMLSSVGAPAVNILDSPTHEHDDSLDTSTEEPYTFAIARQAAHIAVEAALARLSTPEKGEGMYLENGIELHQCGGMLSSEDETMPTKLRERVAVGTDADGKIIYKWACGRTPKEVQASVVRLHMEYGLVEGLQSSAGEVASTQVEDGPQAGMTFHLFVSEWFDMYKAPKLKPTTLKGYRSMLNTHLYPAFGEKLLADISTADIQSFLNERSNLSRKYLKDMVIFLRGIFTDAMEDGHLKKNPAVSRKLNIPSMKKKERQALTKTQMLNVLSQIEKLPAKDRRLVTLLMLTGMRRGEVLGLRWEDIDIEKGLINVRRNVTYAQNQPHIGTPKTKSGERVIPLDPLLQSLLQPVQGEGFIIGDEKPITLMVFRRWWKRIEKQVDMFGATPHIFRHSYLTFVSNAGVDIKTVQAIAGHADISTTMNVYVHPQVDHIVQAGHKIGAHLLAHGG